MQVILLERIKRLGNMGEEVTVRDGFGRNFLIPQKKALRASEGNRKLFESRRADIEKNNAQAREAAEKIAKTIDGVSITLVRQASEEGKLYGSVTVRDVSDALEQAGHHIPRNLLDLPGAIKSTGAVTVSVTLHPEVIAKVTLNVVRSESDTAAA